MDFFLKQILAKNKRVMNQLESQIPLSVQALLETRTIQNDKQNEHEGRELKP